MSKHGVSEAVWDEAKAQAVEVMRAAARARDLVFYSQLVARISAIEMGPRDPRVGKMLREVSEDEVAAGRGMLSVLVVRKSDSMPGKNFFTLASELGRDARDEMACWMRELQRVYSEHA